MENLIRYIKNNKVSKKRLEAEISDERNQKLPQRNVFVLLKSYAKKYFIEGSHPRMIALSGLRGVGKTTLMWQIADYVFKNYTKNIFFISVDDLNRLGATLFQVINIFENEIFNTTLNEISKKIMIIIDEVHEAKDWQKDLKILYEKGKKIFVVVTGSSALMLNSSDDLATRWSLLKIYPFNFSEFILAKSWMKNPKNLIYPIKGLSKNIIDSIFYSYNYQIMKKSIVALQEQIIEHLKKIELMMEISKSDLIEEYVSYHNIARFLPMDNKSLIVDRILGLFDRIIQKDIPQKNVENILIYNRLLFRIAVSDVINYQTLSKEFRIKQVEIENIITNLNNGEILNIFLPYGGLRTRTGGNKKVFFMSPSLRKALYSRLFGDHLKKDLKAKLFEDIIAMYLRKIISNGIVSFGFGKKKNPDFFIENMDLPLIIEIGLNKTKVNQIKLQSNYRYGIIINTKQEEIIFDDKNKILFIPISWFLLM